MVMLPWKAFRQWEKDTQQTECQYVCGIGGNTDDTSRQVYCNAGMDMVMGKPIAIKVLMQLLHDRVAMTRDV